jgi:hypothetical protein
MIRHTPEMPSIQAPPARGTIVIPRDQAVFWLDREGRWCNAHGPFGVKRISDYFHRAIRRDRGGYYVMQQRGGIREKVYFRCEDTALFALRVTRSEPLRLVLNTGREVALRPRCLQISGDRLYMRLGTQRVKFSQNALVSIATRLEEHHGSLVLRHAGRRWRVALLDLQPGNGSAAELVPG